MRRLPETVSVIACLVVAVSCARGDLKRGHEAYKAGKFKEALAQWQPLALRGNAEAQYEVGQLFASGEGVPEDKTEGVRWYRKAADQGFAKAQHKLGVMYYYGEGIKEDKFEAARLFRRAADQGDPDAQVNLGLMYHEGEGLKADRSEAVRWIRKAAEQGHAEAQAQLARFFYKGDGVTQDKAEAARWCRKAAEQGDGWAQGFLGALLLDGDGVTQDKAEAARWHRKAADQGLAMAQHNLACMYDNGDGVPKDQVEATAWFRKAAEQGFVQAQRQLGDRYSLGIGAKRDDIEAYFWYNLAAAAGDAFSADLRDLQAKLFMKPEQVAEAQHRASEWHAKKANKDLSGLRALSAPEVTCTGFVVSAAGHVLTAAHGVTGSSRIRVRLDSGMVEDAQLIARDPTNDLALLKIGQLPAALARFRDGKGPRLGDAVAVVGFPLQGLLGSDIQTASGNVSALAGPNDDTRLFQVTIPIQQGNSGGPVLDESGNVVGMVVAKLDALRIAAVTGDIPQNVGFALSSTVARTFLDSKGIDYQSASSSGTSSTTEIAERARKFTVLVQCWR